MQVSIWSQIQNLHKYLTFKPMEIGLKKHTSVPCTIVHTIARILHQGTLKTQKLLDGFSMIYILCTPFRGSAHSLQRKASIIAIRFHLFRSWLQSREYWMFIDVKPFSLSNDLANPLPPSLPFTFSFAVFLCVAGQAYWRGEGCMRGGGVEKPNRRTWWKSLVLKNHWILSAPAPAITHMKWLTAALKVQ
jgi:hypothetical protein